ncbi:unnamed protein product [Lymnaea stagnalis]|uniref:Uncharacterized protein n=1 Tax=Lymnaea stagnalis TaxID=6523 RepID=A0AAV2IMH2_LYMST
MVQIFWTILYIALGFWIFSRAVAFIIQWLLKRYLDVTLRFGKVGLLNFGKVQMTLQRDVSVHVELEKIWLSSSFVNPDVRKPVVICIEDMRIQVDVSNHGEQPNRTTQDPVQPTQGQPLVHLIRKIMSIGSYGGLRINNITVMLLKTMVPDCLIHFSSPEVSLDISAAYDKYEICVNLNNFGCKALRTSAETPDPGQQNCLGEFSFTFKMDAKVDKTDPIKLTVLKTVIAKPQMMITEGFLQSLQMINTRRLVNIDTGQLLEDVVPVVEPITQERDCRGEESYVPWPTDTIFSRLKLFEKLQDISFDISDLNAQVVRETKQRSLSVSLRLFHLGFHNQSFWQATDINCNVYLEVSAEID